MLSRLLAIGHSLVRIGTALQRIGAPSKRGNGRQGLVHVTLFRLVVVLPGARADAGAGS